MRYQERRIGFVKDWDSGKQMIASIENDPKNSYCYGNWNSGYATRLKEGAELKIQKINEKLDRLYPDEE